MAVYGKRKVRESVVFSESETEDLLDGDLKSDTNSLETRDTLNNAELINLAVEFDPLTMSPSRCRHFDKYGISGQKKYKQKPGANSEQKSGRNRPERKRNSERKAERKSQLKRLELNSETKAWGQLFENIEANSVLGEIVLKEEEEKEEMEDLSLKVSMEVETLFGLTEQKVEEPVHKAPIRKEISRSKRTYGDERSYLYERIDHHEESNDEDEGQLKRPKRRSDEISYLLEGMEFKDRPNMQYENSELISSLIDLALHQYSGIDMSTFLEPIQIKFHELTRQLDTTKDPEANLIIKLVSVNCLLLKGLSDGLSSWADHNKNIDFTIRNMLTFTRKNFSLLEKHSM